MLESGAKIVRDCNRWGMPLLVMIYPRGKGIDPASPQTIGQCVRVAEELGADMIKTSYPGDPAFCKDHESLLGTGLCRRRREVQRP